MGSELWRFARAELDDTKLLVEKITALGEIRRSRSGSCTGPRHLMEHLIMRKQNQVDWLRRARRAP